MVAITTAPLSHSGHQEAPHNVKGNQEVCTMVLNCLNFLSKLPHPSFYSKTLEERKWFFNHSQWKSHSWKNPINAKLHAWTTCENGNSWDLVCPDYWTLLYCFQQSSVNFLYHTCQTMTVKNVQIVWEKPQMFLKQWISWNLL